MKQPVLGSFLTAIVLVGLSIAFLPWWVTVFVISGLVGGAMVMLSKRLGCTAAGMVRGILDLKSAVLRGASVEVHAVALTTTPEPTRDDGDETPDPVARFVLVDATITPRPGESSMSHWEPGELALVRFEQDTSFEALSDRDEVETTLERVVLVSGPGEEAEEEGCAVVGQQRLRLVFACPADFTGRAKLRYYLEGLGDLRIPA